MTHIRKAIFPVAGLGTRFLPATKAMPKEMLPVVDRPLIQHVVDEAREAGIEHLIFVTGRNKGVIEDHFDRQFELELTLIERGKKAELALSVGGPAGGGHGELHPPAVAARARPCGVVRARAGRSRAVRAAVAGRAGAAQAGLPRADDRRGQGSRRQRQHHRGGGSARRARAHVRHRRRRQEQGQGLRHHQDGGEAEEERGAVQSVDHRPLHPAAGDFRHPGKAGGRRRRRDPAHRRHAAAGAHAAVLRLEVRRPRFDCGSKIGFLAANVAYGLARPDIAPEFKAEIERLLREK